MGDRAIRQQRACRDIRPGHGGGGGVFCREEKSRPNLTQSTRIGECVEGRFKQFVAPTPPWYTLTSPRAPPAARHAPRAARPPADTEGLPDAARHITVGQCRLNR